jgi:hypothetical protein
LDVPQQIISAVIAGRKPRDIRGTPAAVRFAEIRIAVQDRLPLSRIGGSRRVVLRQ